MALSGRLWFVVVGALVAHVPAAEAARQKTGKASKVIPAGTKAKLVALADSRGCKLWASESAARRIREIASHGSLTWQGVCKSGLISGTGVLRAEGQTAIEGRTKKFALFQSGSAHRGVRTGKWKLESFEKFRDSPKFTAGIATVDFVNGVAVGTPRPVAVSSWSQYTISFSTRILAPALKEQSQSASASAGQSAALLSDVPAGKSAEPAGPAEVPRSSPVVGPAANQVASRPSPPLTQPPAKAAEPAPPATAAVAPAPEPTVVPVPDKAPATAGAPAKASPPASFSVFALASALASKLASALTPAPAPVTVRGPAPAPAPAAPSPSPSPSPSPAPAPRTDTSPENVPATPVAAASTPNTPREAPVKLTAEIPAFVEGQRFALGSGCYMDTLDGQVWEGQVLAVRDRKAIRIHGWGIDADENRLSEATYLRLESSDGRRFYAATIPEDRPDVARYLGSTKLVKSGYRALVSAESLPAGEYDVMILMNAGGRNILCGNGRTLKL